MKSGNLNPLTPNDPYRGRTTPLTSKVAFHIFIQQIQVLNILNVVYNLSLFPFQNAVCFIILMYLVPILFTFYIHGVLKLKKKSGAKWLTSWNPLGHSKPVTGLFYLYFLPADTAKTTITRRGKPSLPIQKLFLSISLEQAQL